MTESDDEPLDFSEIQQDQNRKQRRAGGWQSLGLDHIIYKAIERKGFRQPTPIQRKTIPCIMDGKDVVAMSRTGSGKTAAFVIPLLQRLKRRETTGIRGLLISPTRELALQTFTVIKELGRFTGLRCAVLVGGDAIEEQFATIHENPDILIATPGRLLHVIVEMDLRLSHVEYVVFDEADRLFEMGFQDQLLETLKRIPDCRQTLLFSATLPKMLVDFAKAGLNDPMLVRLDVDEKMSDRLSMAFAFCRAEEKLPVVLSLCRQMEEEKKQTLVFCATMKHVEYLVAILTEAGIPNSYIYSQLDGAARRQNIAKFRNRQTNILVVTDVAARGVDIPLLDMVINMHFPPKPKLFVHRAGRVARAGRHGTAISLVAPDELAYLVDLFIFLGKPIQFAKQNDEYDESVTLIGRVPDRLISNETDFLRTTHEVNNELCDSRTKSENAMMKYTRTRPPPSAESARRCKQQIRAAAVDCALHPYLRTEQDIESVDILSRLANYKSNATIFELNIGSKSQTAQVMKEKRRVHEEHIKSVKEEKVKSIEKQAEEDANRAPIVSLEQADDSQVTSAFTTVIGSTTLREALDEKRSLKRKYKKFDKYEQRRIEKERHYVPYTSADHDSERHLQLQTVDFARQAEGAVVDIIADDDKGLYKATHQKRWDRKKKKFVTGVGDDQKKLIRTEEGTWLPASYKTGKYEEWKGKQRLAFKKTDDDGDDAESKEKPYGGRKFRHNKGKPGQMKGGRSELKPMPQIMKERKNKNRLQNLMERRRQDNVKRKANAHMKGRGKR